MNLIFDCTALSRWEGQFTGISRVILEIGTKLGQWVPSCTTGVLDSTDGIWRHYDPESRTTGDVIAMPPQSLIVTLGANWDHQDHHAALMGCVAQGARLGVLYYDTIPISHPQSYGPGFPPIYEKWLKETLEAASTSFAISENSARDIQTFCQANGLADREVHVLRLGDNLPEPRDNPSEDIVEKAAVPYLLTVSTVEFRKNHQMLLNLWRYMIEDLQLDPPNLYIVGRPGWNDGMIQFQIELDPLLKGRVQILSDLSDDDLQHLYRNTLFTLYPSIYEGWGLPIAESLCYGKQCVASSKSSMIEIAPGLTRHAHPLLIEEWVTHIRELTENPELLAAEQARIAAEYKIATWDQSAHDLAVGLIKQFPTLIAGTP
jgi:glycosyltransferase involved in cell wall biosynthesis